METRLSNIFKTRNVTNLTKAILKSYKSSISYIQIENTKTTSLLFKGSWILLSFLTLKLTSLWLYFGKSRKTKHFRKPTEVFQNKSTLISIGYPLRNNDHLKTWEICVFWRFFFQNKNWWHFEFSMNHIFGQRFIIFGKLRNRVLLLLKLWALEVVTSFH